MNILTPDFVTYGLTHQLSAVTLHERFLELCWQDHLRSRFHYIWLRDNCAAPQSINPVTREQTYDICQAPEDIHPECADIAAEGALRIIWAHDRPESLYHPGWLREHRYDNRLPAQANAITWDARFQVPRFSGTAVLSDDAALHDWLLAQHHRCRGSGWLCTDRNRSPDSPSRLPHFAVLAHVALRILQSVFRSTGLITGP